MSISDQIDRIEAAKEAIATAITGKSVTVPDGTLIDGMAALIESIEAGSGGSAQVATGSVKPTATSLYNYPVVVDGIGFEPKTVILILKGINTVSTNNQECVVCRIAGELGDYAVSGIKISVGCQFKGGSASYYPITLSADGFTLNSIDSTYYIFTSNYAWIAIG